MKTSARAISALITAFVAIALILWGTHAFNTHRYDIDTPDPTHRAGIIREYGGFPVDGDYLRGIHYSAHGTPHPGAVIIFGATAEPTPTAPATSRTRATTSSPSTTSANPANNPTSPPSPSTSSTKPSPG